MTLTVPLSVIGFVLLLAPAWAADFSAELDFVTRALAQQSLRDRGITAGPRPNRRPQAEDLRASAGRGPWEGGGGAFYCSRRIRRAGSDGARRGASGAPDRVAGQVRRGL